MTHALMLAVVVLLSGCIDLAYRPQPPGSLINRSGIGNPDMNAPPPPAAFAVRP